MTRRHSLERRALLAAAGFTLAACGAEPPEAPPALVIRPAAVRTLALSVERTPLPGALAGDATLAVAADAGGRVLVGGQGGLFELTAEAVSEIDTARTVTALAALDGDVVVGSAEGGVEVYDGDLVPSPLTEQLGAMNVSALAARGDELWLGADGALHLLDAGALYAFDQLPAAAAIHAFAGGDTVVVDTEQGQFGLAADRLELQTLSDEIGADRIVPAAGGRILAVANGLLAERVDVEGGVTWRPVALTEDPEDPGAGNVRDLAVDPVAGSVWVVTTTELARVSGDTVETMAMPTESPIASVSVAVDGAVWLNDGANLLRVGGDETPTTFSEDIAPFSENNCERCHNPLGVGHPLQTYEAWKDEVDQIIAALQEGRMPQDGAALVGGSAALIEKWKNEGLRP